MLLCPPLWSSFLSVFVPVGFTLRWNLTIRYPVPPCETLCGDSAILWQIPLMLAFLLVRQKCACQSSITTQQLLEQAVLPFLLCSLSSLPDFSEPQFYPLYNGPVILLGTLLSKGSNGM